MSVVKRILKCLILGLMACCPISCNSGNRNTPVIEKEVDHESLNLGDVGKDSTSNKKVIEAWKIDTAAWNALPKKWVGLSRTKTGYVVYKPCDGVTPTIDLDSLKLKIDGEWQDGVIGFGIKHFQKTKINEYQIIGEIEGWARIKLKMRLVQPKLNLWLIDGFFIEKDRGNEQYLRWVMTTKSNSKKFRVVKNPCPTQKIREKEFLPDEFNNPDFENQ